MDGVRAIVKLAEDHLAGGSLKNAGDGNVDGLSDHFLGVLHHHQGALVEIGHALVELFPFLENEHPHDLARQHDGLHRIGELVDVENHHAVQLRHLVEVEIVGDDLAIVNLGQLDQLHIHFADVREIVLHNLDVEMGHFLNSLQNVEPAAAAVALHGIGRIGHHLQLVQHELWNHQDSIEKAS